MCKCNNCKREFEQPEIINTTYEALYGVSSMFNNFNRITLKICPFCNSEDIENDN